MFIIKKWLRLQLDFSKDVKTVQNGAHWFISKILRNLGLILWPAGYFV